MDITYKEFNAVVLPLKDKMYKYAFYMLGDRMDAEDVVQDVCEKLWTKKNNLHLMENPEAYVFRSVKNLCCDRLSSEKLHRDVNIQHNVYQLIG